MVRPRRGKFPGLMDQIRPGGLTEELRFLSTRGDLHPGGRVSVNETEIVQVLGWGR